ncbi:MAG: bifunctional lysine ketoglutarate reductase /saccharopine dehydrogenase family protein [Bacteroidales bacterium]
MSSIIGIRHEDKYAMERRTPLTPKHVGKLIKEHNLDFVIQTSPKRVFSDFEYKNVGASVEPDLKKCDVIFGVKEIPESAFENNKTYIFFSHVIKGQSYNMPMLKKMMELGCNLIDYEVITDDQNRRLIFFGKYAGLAGMINSLWSTGQRLKEMGYSNNPFLKIKQSCEYNSLAEAKQQISEVGKEISKDGLPKELQPFTIGFTGYGNVSNGAQEIANLLPSVEITPGELLKLKDSGSLPSNILYKVVFKEEHISKLKDGSNADFDLEHYYNHPEEYQNDFEKYIPHLSILMNCMYWDSRYPRIFTKEYAKKLYEGGKPKIIVVGDVTCDPDGSIEFTHKGTEIEDPVFVYDPINDKPAMGFKGEGILVMAVDILPSELPRDSSNAFADALYRFALPIAKADFSEPLADIKLPLSIKKALILKNGKLTPEYEYIEQYLK